jgi:general secretion pathway protein J
MRRNLGFTLIEVLVALGLMALLGLMSWRGLDTLLRTREATQSRTDQVALVQTSLGQWRADLNSQMALPGMLGDNSMMWNGSVLRILRRSSNPMADGGDAGMQVVAWTLREGFWRRWQSAPIENRSELEQAWLMADLWGQNPSTELLQQEVKLMPLSGWQLFYFRDNAWTNPLSSSGVGTADKLLKSPDAVQLLLQLNTKDKLTLDWVRPAFNPKRP